MSDIETGRVPETLRAHQAAIREIQPGEQAIRYQVDTWFRYLPDDADLFAIHELSNGVITRAHLFEISRLAFGDDGQNRRLFLATMLWGFGTIGRGQWRTMKILCDPRLPATLVATLEYLRAGQVGRAYQGFRVKWCGASFVTKFLYVAAAGLDVHPQPLVLDSRVARSLGVLQARGELGEARYFRADASGCVLRNVDGYEQFIRAVEAWAQEIDCRGDQIELFLANPPVPLRHG